jgi:hypothetical protein
MISAHGSSVSMTCTGKDCCWLLTSICTPFWRSSGSSAGSFGATVVLMSRRARPSTVSGLFNVAAMASPLMTTFATLPSASHA